MAAPLFDVRRGDHARVARLGGAMLSILAGFTMSETARDSLFLGTNGAGQLAIAYLLLAGVAVIALALNAWLVRRLGRRVALAVTLIAAAIGTSAFAGMPRDPTAAFGLYLWSGLIGTIVVVQFWLFAGTRFTSAEAKRLFGPIAALGAVGTLIGAGAAWLLLHVLEIEHLLVIAAALYVLPAVVLALDRETVEPRVHLGQVKRRQSELVAGIRGNRYVVSLATLTICATAAALLADYLLKSAAAAAFDTEGLAQFIARYNGTVAGLSLLFQVVGAAWLARKVGVLGMSLLLPVLMLGGGIACVLTGGAFLAVGLTKGADASLRYSVNRVANELLWMPVADNVRAGVREPLESVVMRVVQALTAALLLLLVTLGHASLPVVGAILCGIALVWTVTAARLRQKYLGQLERSVSRHTPRPEIQLDVNSLDAVVEALSSDDARRVIAAINVLVARRRPKLLPALLLRHESVDVVAAALSAMATPGRTDWIPRTQRLLNAPDPRARTIALRALAQIDDETAIVAGLCDDDPGVVAHGVFWSLKRASAAEILANPAVTTLIAETGSRGVSAHGQLLEAIRAEGDPRWVEVMLELARSPDDNTIERLVLAIQQIPDPRFVSFLIGRLGTRASRPGTRLALRAIGQPALIALEDALQRADTPARVRLHVPSTIAVFGSSQAAAVLGKQLVREPAGPVRYRLLRALSQLAVRAEIAVDPALLLAELQAHLHEYTRLLAVAVPLFEDDDMSESAVLLRGIVQDKISQALDRAFIALQALHPDEPIRAVERAVQGDDARARAHGMEFLDTLTRSPTYGRLEMEGVRERLLIVGEDLGHRERLTRLGISADIPATLAEAVGRLAHEEDTLLAAFAGYHALELKLPTLEIAIAEIERRRPLFAPLGLVHASTRVR
ncbi:MAG: HEAT repeat domain-containing protein [Kofleriaceae bacterium]